MIGPHELSDHIVPELLARQAQLCVLRHPAREQMKVASEGGSWQVDGERYHERAR